MKILGSSLRFSPNGNDGSSVGKKGGNRFRSLFQKRQYQKHNEHDIVVINNAVQVKNNSNRSLQYQENVETSNSDKRENDPVANSDIEMQQEEEAPSTEYGNNIEDLFSSGDTYFSNEDYHSALEQYEKILEVTSMNKELQHVTNKESWYFEQQYYLALATTKVGEIQMKNNCKKEAHLSFDHSLQVTQKILLDRHKASRHDKRSPDDGDILFRVLKLMSQTQEKMILIYVKDGNYTIAEDKFKFAISSRQEIINLCSHSKFKVHHLNQEEVLKSQKLQLALVYHQLGGVCHQRGKYKESIEAYSLMLRLREEVLETCHPMINSSLLALSDAKVANGDFESALADLDTILEFLGQAEDANHADVAEVLMKKSSVYVHLEELKTAMTLAVDAFGLIEHIDDEDGENSIHLRKATAMEQIGYVYEKQIKLRDAIECHKKAFSMRIAALCPEHDLVTKSAIQIGYIHCLRGEYDHAKSIYTEVKDKLVAAYGVAHPSIATVLDKVALMYFEQRGYNTSIKYYMKSIEVRRKFLKSMSHPDIADGMRNVGLCLLKKNRKREAMDHFTAALHMYREAHFCATHPSVVETIRSMTDFDHEEDDLESTSVFS